MPAEGRTRWRAAREHTSTEGAESEGGGHRAVGGRAIHLTEEANAGAKVSKAQTRKRDESASCDGSLTWKHSRESDMPSRVIVRKSRHWSGQVRPWVRACGRVEVWIPRAVLLPVNADAQQVGTQREHVDGRVLGVAGAAELPTVDGTCCCAGTGHAFEDATVDGTCCCAGTGFDFEDAAV